MLVASFVAAAAYAIFGTIHEYAAGPALVWISGQTHIRVTAPGTVREIGVKPGEHVEAGRLLVSLASAVEQADVSRIDRELEAQLAPSRGQPDPAAPAAIAALRAQRDLAAARLEQLSIRAPHAGVVGAIRITPGQLLQAGEWAITLVSDDHQCSVQAMLPAQYRPRLRRGMAMRFAATGYGHAYQELAIASVGAQAIGPSEVKRFLGQDLEDALSVNGPVVVVEAAPCAPSFEVDGQAFDYFHGMTGVAEVRLQTQRLVVALVPGLQAVFGNSND